jgi:EamA domain-containing membrane protein RarD
MSKERDRHILSKWEQEKGTENAINCILSSMHYSQVEELPSFEAHSGICLQLFATVPFCLLFLLVQNTPQNQLSGQNLSNLFLT